MNRSFFAYVFLALFFTLPATAFAAAPFSDTFDDYQLGSLVGQGLWLHDEDAWHVTDQGCYQNTGKCIVTTGINGENWKSGTDLATGEWRLHFYATSPFSSFGLRIYFAPVNNPSGESELDINNDSTSTIAIFDNRGNVMASHISLGAWHTLTYSWDMSDPGNCTFLVSVDGFVPVASSPSLGNPSNCYGNIYVSHTIGSMGLFSYYAAPGFFIDDIGSATTTEPAASAACTSNCYSNVMFLPGIEGSRLYENSGSSEKRVWEPGSDADALQLAMSADGSSTNAIYTKTGDVVDQACVAVFCADIYKSFIANMNDLKTQGIINDWEPISYDWRLSFSQLLDGGVQNGSQISYLSSSNTPYIITQLKALAATSKTGKVTLVTHSNGGLLAKALMMRLGPDASKYIDKVVMVAAPQLGTPEAIPDILHGNAGIKFLLSNSAARSVAQNLPGAYNLLPSNNYFTYVDNPVVSFDTATLSDWAAKYGGVVHSTDRLRAFMADATRMTPASDDLNDPTIANSGLFDASTATHAELDAWMPPADIKVYEIAGWGNDTLSGIEYKKVVTSTCTNYLFGLCTNVATSSKLTFDPKEVVDGDGTVMAPSALWSNGASTTQYWVDIFKAGRSHRDILEIPSISTLINSVVIGNTSAPLPQYISSSQPASSNGVRLHFTLHSPLTLGFTDSSGNYTGSTATATLFNSPGVEYQRYGDVQYLSVPAGISGTLLMHGTASGSFSLDVEQTSGDTIFATTSFQGVLSSTSTVATMQISTTSSPTADGILLVDFDGDGTTDSTLQAKQGAIVLPDITPPEAILSADTAAHDLGVVGVDDVSSTTIQKTATTTTIIDASGNRTTLSFQKTYSGKLLTYARLTSIQYGSAAPIQLPDSFTYLWDSKQTLVSQTVVADKQFIVEALYDKTKNKTTIIVLQKNIPIKTQTVTGLATIKLTTYKGVVSYGW